MDGPSFEFQPKQWFLADVFNGLPAQETDTEQLTLAVIQDDEYFEATEEFRASVSAKARPIIHEAFIKLLDSFDSQLSALMADSGDRLMHPHGPFRAPPSEYFATIRSGKHFLYEHLDRELYLIVYQYL